MDRKVKHTRAFQAGVHLMNQKETASCFITGIMCELQERKEEFK